MAQKEPTVELAETEKLIGATRMRALTELIRTRILILSSKDLELEELALLWKQSRTTPQLRKKYILDRVEVEVADTVEWAALDHQQIRKVFRYAAVPALAEAEVVMGPVVETLLLALDNFAEVALEVEVDMAVPVVMAGRSAPERHQANADGLVKDVAPVAVVKDHRSEAQLAGHLVQAEGEAMDFLQLQHNQRVVYLDALLFVTLPKSFRSIEMKILSYKNA